MNSSNHHGRRVEVGDGAYGSGSDPSRCRVVGPLRAARTRVAALLHAWPWTAVAVRVCSLGAALVILAWIGRTAATAQASIVRVDADAGPLTSAARPAASVLGASARGVVSVEASALPPASATSLGTSHPRATVADPVYVNQASIDELRRLPGVGPKRAEAILALRRRVGRFQRVEDLLRVKGVGRSTLRKWRPLVRLDAPAPAVTTTGERDAGGP